MNILTSKKRQAIIERINQEGSVHYSKFVKDLGVSPPTVRRYLTLLDTDGLIKYKWGKASKISLGGLPADQTTILPIEESVIQRIVPLIRREKLILLDWNPLVRHLPTRFPKDFPTTVITNSPIIASAFADHPQVEVRVIGGKLRNGALIPVDVDSVELLKIIHIDLCILGPCSLNKDTGISVSSYEDAKVKRAMISAAFRIVVFASGENINHTDNFSVGPINKVTHILPIDIMSDEELKPYIDLGIEILYG